MRLAFIALLAVVAAAPACGRARERFHLARDPASRYGFAHVQDRESGLWVHVHCELRVSVDRRLPDPLRTEDQGDMISFTQYSSQSMGSAGIAPSEFVVRDGQRVWLWRVLADEAMLDGSAALSVQVSWPVAPGTERQSDPMELFTLPTLNSLEPYRWSPWREADEVRGGFFAGWEKLHGVASDGSPKPAQPFALRCRPVLADFLFVPIEAEDPNVAKPEPNTMRAPSAPATPR